MYEKLGLPSIEAAMIYMGKAILEKKEDQFAALGLVPEFDTQTSLNRFKRSGFSDADVARAKKVFKFLDGATDEAAKAYLGLKLLRHDRGDDRGMEMLDIEGIKEASLDPDEKRLAFERSGLTQRNVDAARTLFGFTPADSDDVVKQFIGQQVLNAKAGNQRASGYLRDITAAATVPSASQGLENSALQRFARSSFTDDDVAKVRREYASALSGASDDSVREFIGARLLSADRDEVAVGFSGTWRDIFNYQGITESPFDLHEQAAAFKRSGYGMAEVTAAKEKFEVLADLSDPVVKRFIGLQLLTQNQDFFDQLGVEGRWAR